jgi:hypothetical protein
VSRPESNPLRAALAADGGDHPDAGLLTAFAESTLGARERRQVLDHLARCADCREVLALVADTEPMPAVAAEGRWWRLRVLAPTLAAAAVVIAVSVVVVERQAGLNQKRESAAVGREATGPLPAAARQSAPAPMAAKATENKGIARKVAPVQAAQIPAMQAPDATGNSGLKTTLGLVQPSQRQALPVAKKATPWRSSVALSPLDLGTTEAREQAKEELVRRRAAAPEMAPPAAAAPGGAGVSGGSYVVPAAPPTSAFANTMTAEALDRAPADKSLARPHWRINAQGQAERALGGGPWMPVMSNVSAKMRVVSVFGGEVWVGGEKGLVYRSADGGETWEPVLLPEKGGKEHTILHIRFGSGGEIRIEAADGTSWVSEDGGTTWN